MPQQIIRVRVEAVSLDSTAVKVHPDGTGALKKQPTGHRQVESRMDNKDSYGCLRRSDSGEFFTLAW